MALFSKRPSAIPTDLAEWPGMDDNRLQAENEAAPERMTSFMPAEWHPQRSVQLTWPHEGTDWAEHIDEVTDCYIRMAYEISVAENLIIVCRDANSVTQLLKQRLPKKCLSKITMVECPTNDTWARDHGFITIVDEGQYKLLDFCFNGWGGKFEARLDNAINRQLYDSGVLRGEYCDCQDIVLEGGSIESDGRGTLLTTTQCLMNPNRNPSLGKAEIEETILTRLKARRLLWLDHGFMVGDDTDCHIDTLARLCPNDTIVYVRCDDPADEHYEELRLMEEQLMSMITLHGEPYRLLPLPMAPRLYDEEGGRLPATYANYLVINGRVLMPIYGDFALDEKAKVVIGKAFPNREVIGIDCRILVWQHGSLHCSTMQYY